MIALQLETKSREQELIKAYLEENVSQMLADKINNGVPTDKDGKPLISRKDLDGFFLYATEEARKLADKNATNACIEDKTVFGWAIHYFEEDSIIGKLYYIDGTEYQPPKPKTKTASIPIAPPKPESKAQFSLFDLMDNENNKIPDVEEKTEEPDDEEYETISEEEQQEILRELDEEDAKLEERALSKPAPPKGSPLYQKYMQYQKQNPYSVVAMRLGDFYEVFGDNAVTLANELELTLTGRDCGLESRVPMIGFPYHAAEIYFNKITVKHSITVVETDTDIKQIPMKVQKPNETLDMETGEILSEEEMREFDGDIYEPKELSDDLRQEHEIAKAFDKETLFKLSDILGDIFIVR